MSQQSRIESHRILKIKRRRIQRSKEAKKKGERSGRTTRMRDAIGPEDLDATATAAAQEPTPPWRNRPEWDRMFHN